MPAERGRARVLIAGATGYVGRLLALRLAEQAPGSAAGGGNAGATGGRGTRAKPPRCLARNPERAADLAAAGCEVVTGDVLEPETLAPALAGVETAYYLVHSMGRGSEGDFAALDRRAADNFAAAAAEAGVRRIIYLGGLGEGGSAHLRSRADTAEHLAAAGVPVIHLRAAVIIGAGSASFRTIYHLIRRLPVMVTPRWTDVRTQPIAIADVIEYLIAAAELPDEAGAGPLTGGPPAAGESAPARTIEIGGPDVTTYGGLMDALSDALGRRRAVRISVPLLTPWLSSLWIGLVTPVDPGVARPLIEGLSTETVVRDPSGMARFTIRPRPLEQAMDEAVATLRAEEQSAETPA
ncbi:MAG TPA: NAD(P)H-binding protein [Solirubrobacterales bacterium]|nr:NAD(P)H-binding protein [Solirubrobacterales bacterium]